MRFRQPHCPKCGSWPASLVSTVAALMNLCRVDANGRVVNDDDETSFDFEHLDSDPNWDYEEMKRSPDGKVELYCPNRICEQGWWHTDLLSQREIELEAAVQEWADAQAALEPSPVLASHQETERVAAAENRLRELVKKQPA